jgi:anti-sigma regulatory factor (Ser/Thr protein kinase)
MSTGCGGTSGAAARTLAFPALRWTAVSFQHEAMIYAGADDFAGGALPFIREGLEADEPVMVAIGAERIEMLRGELGSDAGGVTFVDMAELGRNPARIIPAWSAFLDGRAAGRGIRGIGEPIWAARGADELVECQLHESLLNVAFADVPDFRLLCPYDAGALEAAVVHEAHCSHPIVDSGGSRGPSQSVREHEELLAPFDAPLPPPLAPVEAMAFDRHAVNAVRGIVAGRAADAGLAGDRTRDLVLAVDEIVVNSIRHGGGNGVLRLWQEDHRLVCEVTDRGHITDPLAGRHRPVTGQCGGWGMFIANQLCDLVQMRSGEQGTAVRLHMRLC